ncbi:MAG: transglutaminase domain-containing protein [Thermoplasmata archaeon]
MSSMLEKIFCCLLSLLFCLPHAGAFQIFNDVPPAFTESDLRVPAYVEHNYTPETPPQPSQDIFPVLNCKLQPLIIGEIYAEFGGTARIYLINNNRTDFQRPSSNMYILNISIVWHNSIKTTRAVGKYADTGEKVDLGIWNFETPKEAGKYLYNFEITVFAMDFNTGLWAGPRNISFKESEMEVTALGTPYQNIIVNNEKEIYSEINSLARPTGLVEAKLREIRANTTENYTTHLLLGIFEYVCGIEYAQEPNGSDYWQTPDETITRNSGDCEDFAILLSSLVSAAGGTARFCYTNNHAFAVVYIGENFSEIKRAVDGYYFHKMNMVFVKDNFGYWVVADPAGEPYLGGLPVSGIPTGRNDDQTWEWHLNSTYMGMIDITLKDYKTISSYLLYIYVLIIIIFTSIAVILLYFYSIPRCALCGRRIKKQEIVRCQNCDTPYHVSCFSTLYFCKCCNAGTGLLEEGQNENSGSSTQQFSMDGQKQR